MSLEANKKDFETALEEMKEVIIALDYCVDDAMMETLKSVVNEYETHFQPDIEEIVNKNEELKEELEEHENK